MDTIKSQSLSLMSSNSISRTLAVGVGRVPSFTINKVLPSPAIKSSNVELSSGFSRAFLSVLLSVLSFIISGFSLLVLAVFGYSMPYDKKWDIVMLILTMLLIYFYIGPLRYAVIKLMFHLAALVGIL